MLLTDTRTGVNAKEWKTDYAPGEVRYVPIALAGMVTGTLHLPSFAIATVNSVTQADYFGGLAAMRKDSEIDQALNLPGHVSNGDIPLTSLALRSISHPFNNFPVRYL